MKTIKGFSALMLAAAFMISTAAIAAPSKIVVKQQAKTEKKAPVKTEKTVEKKTTEKKVNGKKSVKKVSKTEVSKKEVSKPAPATK
jgi:hypothetical protein